MFSFLPCKNARSVKIVVQLYYFIGNPCLTLFCQVRYLNDLIQQGTKQLYLYSIKESVFFFKAVKAEKFQQSLQFKLIYLLIRISTIVRSFFFSS